MTKSCCVHKIFFKFQVTYIPENCENIIFLVNFYVNMFFFSNKLIRLFYYEDDIFNCLVFKNKTES